MSGTGKYTTYAPTKSSKTDLLKKLFGNGPTGEGVGTLPPSMVVDSAKVIDEVVKTAKANLTPTHQAGDLDMFGSGVDLNFAGAPDLTAVKHDSAKFSFNGTPTNAGGPANPYAPDITSPGPGKTDGSDKVADPGIEVKDLKPTYVPGAPGTGTKSPDKTNSKVVAANELGKSAKLGDSGGNI